MWNDYSCCDVIAVAAQNASAAKRSVPVNVPVASTSGASSSRQSKPAKRTKKRTASASA
jgi:hypothetical protein